MSVVCNLSSVPLILASASPRRRDLLAQIGVVADEIVPADIDETPLKNEQPHLYVSRIAEQKAATIAEKRPDALILAADTTVACGRRILGKAENEHEARQFLQLLSGRRHRVYTAFALAAPNDKVRTKRIMTTVQFRPLSEQDITDYIASGDWQGKAGAYGIQGPAGAFVKQINGSYTSIVGLPLAEVQVALRRFL